ncbi:HAMP domain-containing histidine kinase [Oculatella sp. LEGE 06141]|uniref:sensor histidine kinase n=1 Tax=Oculatella sp. LEGE 06141 TaxID=1828648 RepID=UPI00188218E3|nr:HAMP domain-containing sensor histidine kinase [Oculatella sp. LEGE 06141]MBE9177430.1 HAMP domain-containing histidine kinase [Oculatella sp. LEGE 06141]
MTSTKRSRPGLSKPCLFEASNQGLHLDSPLNELSQYQFQVESCYLAKEVMRLFEQYPLVPGVVVLEQNQFLGMISRQRFLECLIRPQGLDLLLTQPLSVLLSYTRTDSLILPESTPIRVAAQLALRRSPEYQGEPIVVQIDASTYTLLNVHELNIAYWQIRGIETQVRYERTQVQMIQSEKMASLGRLVDGVAHEILDPVSFIWGNLTHVSIYTEQILGLLSAYEVCFPTIPEELQDLQTEIELDYVRQDLPQTIASIKAGADRLKTLVTSLQNFCHIDDVYPKPADLHQSLDSILLLLKSRLTGDIDVVKHYGHLPPVACFTGQLNQVFMNILTNAIDALINQAIRQKLAQEFGTTGTGRRHLQPEPKPQITITTQVRSRQLADPNTDTQNSTMESSRWVLIRIADNGPGLSAEQYQRIMDSFSVKNRTEKETSLAVSYQIVTAKHGGKLNLKSHPDFGTEFEILLPLA